MLNLFHYYLNLINLLLFYLYHLFRYYNYLITDTDLQENAMRCLEKTINNLIEKLEIKKVNVIVYKNGTIANNDKFMKINNVVQRATNLN